MRINETKRFNYNESQSTQTVQTLTRPKTSVIQINPTEFDEKKSKSVAFGIATNPAKVREHIHSSPDWLVAGICKHMG